MDETGEDSALHKIMWMIFAVCYVLCDCCEKLRDHMLSCHVSSTLLLCVMHFLSSKSEKKSFLSLSVSLTVF